MGHPMAYQKVFGLFPRGNSRLKVADDLQTPAEDPDASFPYYLWSLLCLFSVPESWRSVRSRKMQSIAESE
jgi:hypothetical protein